ncbi:MAG: hypothetical protein LBF77_07240 [Spirochaetaceae bacterium]|nr:hypothetical protein [Spirochaetaceae bacterium]
MLEGWLFASLIAMITCHKLYNALREAKLPGNRSPKDIIGISKAVYKLRIQGTWHPAGVTAKVRKLLVKAGTDHLN